MNQVNEAVENLYRVFAHYPLAEVVEGCTCCVEVKDHLALRAAPLRVLPPENLTHYAGHAITTWGGVEDFKHFLPRILEVLSSGNDLGYGAEMIFCKFAYANCQDWPKEEKVAVGDFMMAVWKEILATEAPFEAADWICCIGITGEDLQSYLNIWVEAKSRAAYKQLLESVKGGWILSNAFWCNATKGNHQVVAWLEAKDTSNKLVDIYFENESADFAQPLAECIDMLSAFQK